MFCFNLGEAAVDFFCSRFTVKLYCFLGFQHGSSSSIKVIMPLAATLPLTIGLEFLGF